MTLLQTNNRENNPQKNATDGYEREAQSTHGNSKITNSSGANLIRHIKEDTMEIAEGIAIEGQHKIDDIRSFASKYIQIAEKEIVAKPVQSIAIAFATGAILSLMMGRR